MADARPETHRYREEFHDPMFLKSSFTPSTASLDDLETYLAELGLVQRALASHVELLGARSEDGNDTNTDVEDATALVETLKHHRGVFAIALDQNYWYEEGERTHWLPDTQVSKDERSS